MSSLPLPPCARGLALLPADTTPRLEKMPAVTRRQHPRTARTPRTHAGCASLVPNYGTTWQQITNTSLLSSLLSSHKPPSPSHGFHSRLILLPVGHRFFFWAASSWLLWSAGGVVLVAMVGGRRGRGYCDEPFTEPPALPFTKAARPAIYQSRPKKRRPTSQPPTSYQRRNVHSPLVLRGCYGRAVCFPLVAPRFARLLETQRTFIINPVGVCSTDINLRPLHLGNPEGTQVSE